MRAGEGRENSQPESWFGVCRRLLSYFGDRAFVRLAEEVHAFGRGGRALRTRPRGASVAARRRLARRSALRLAAALRR